MRLHSQTHRLKGSNYLLRSPCTAEVRVEKELCKCLSCAWLWRVHITGRTGVLPASRIRSAYCRSSVKHLMKACAELSKKRCALRRYIYNQARCGRCGGDIRTWGMAARTCYACPTCQPLPSATVLAAARAKALAAATPTKVPIPEPEPKPPFWPPRRPRRWPLPRPQRCPLISFLLTTRSPLGFLCACKCWRMDGEPLG